MPGLYRYLIIAPTADQAGVEAATTDSALSPPRGFHTNTPVYAASEPSPREPWGGWTGTAFTANQEALVEAPAVGARFVFPNTTFLKYHAANVNDPQWPRIIPGTILSGLGLTTLQTDPP